MKLIEEGDRPDEPAPQVTEYAKGDVLAPEWGEAPPWFGYIGVMIAIVSMLLGIAAMVWFGFWVAQWLKS
jgi:hypothetical protein